MNISELAQHLGVAVSTVSRVLSGNADKYRISEKTVQRVQKAAEKYRVVPDPLGAGLRKGKLGMIGLLVPDITNPFFSTLARAIELRFRDTGIAVQLCDSAEDPATEIALLNKLLSRRLDGLIVAPVGEVSDELKSAVSNSPMPLVVLDRLLPGVSVPSVSIDNIKAGKLAANHLIESGHKHLGCLRGNCRAISDQERLKGVEEAMREAGLDPATLSIAGTGYTRELSLLSATELLTLSPRPSGIISLSGQGILGILEASRASGLSIPRDFSVIAFDEQPWSALMQPPITTITQPIESMAEKAVFLLNLEGRAKEVTPEVVEATLCRRESVAAVN
ncbi:MAG: LacI family DNA-binding transcriptional regulator [Verrucomicrobiales bacterium]|nr:LacI family DNA-binding transcriptional regulator [Verrucomicrobiales bacterium]